MSGSLRMSLAPTIKRLLRYVENEEPKLISPLPTDARGQIQAYDDFIKQLEKNIENMQEAVSLLDGKLMWWAELLTRIADPVTLKAEEDAFASMSEKEDGLVAVIERGRDSMRERRSTLKEAKKVSQQLSSPGCAPAAVASKNCVRLPKLKLDEFDGNIKNWPTFWNCFEASVHLQSISDVEKFTYLLTLLKGKARSAVEGYAVRPENYEVVVKLLHKKFGQNEHIVSSLFRELNQIPPVVKNFEFPIVIEKMECIFRQLEALGEKVDSTMVESIVEDKLPVWVLDQVFEAKENNSSWSVSELRSLLTRLADRKEKISASMDGRKSLRTSEQFSEKEFVKRKPQSNFPSKSRVSSTFVAVSSESKGNQRGQNKSSFSTKCFLCSGPHQMSNCFKYRTFDERRSRALELNLCSKCLRSGHSESSCHARVTCFECKGSHVKLLCPQLVSDKGKNERNETVHVSTEVDGEISEADSGILVVESVPAVECSRAREEVLLMCREATVCNVNEPNRKETVLLFFDSGSQKSYIDDQLAVKLGLRAMDSSIIKVGSFGDPNPKVFQSKRVLAGIQLEEGGSRILSFNTMDYLTRKLQVIKVDRKDFEVLKSSVVITSKSEWIQPQILLGLDYLHEFLSTVTLLKSGFCLYETPIGPFVAGRGFLGTRETSLEVTNQYSALDVDEFWKLETLGIRDSYVEKEDETATELFKKSLHRDVSGRYTVGWPWREEKSQLSNTFALCLGRLRNVLNKLRDSPDVLEKYEQIFRDQLSSGIIEEAPKVFKNDSVFYLPHHAVVKPNKNTTKVRIVFDASAKTKGGLSLNESLYRGRIFLPDLSGILLRWREHKFILLGDVEKAFLQVGLSENDRDFTRFLWVKDCSLPLEGDNLVVFRFCRIPFGVISSPSLLAEVLIHHLENSDSPVASKMLQNLYVDNVMMCSDELSEACMWYDQVKKVFKGAKMNIKEFVSNSSSVQATIPSEDLQDSEFVSVLGLKWRIKKDSVVMRLLKWDTPNVTKRVVLRFLASHFDPLGFLVPVLLPWKIYCQKLWTAKLKWDEEPSEELLREWSKLKDSWSNLEIEFPRLMGPVGSKELHVFVDASKLAYAAAVYCRTESQGKVSCQLIFAKSRLCPADGITIPKAELLAALIGARAVKFVKTQLGWDQVPVFAWSDSVCAILWTRTDNVDKFPKFHKNRIKEIRKKGIQFRHVPSESNSADVASRGLLASEFIANDFWWHGPSWILEDKSKWPNKVIEEQPLEIKLAWAKEKGTEVEEEEVYVNVEYPPDNFKGIVDPEKFSSWNLLLGTVMAMNLFLKRLARRPLPIFSSLSGVNDRSSALILAEQMLIRQAQFEITEMDIKKWKLRKGADMIFRVVGRLGSVSIPDRLPAFLPRSNKITKLLIMNAHQKCGHFGVSHTLTCFREKFWIDHGRRTVRKVIREHCRLCRRYWARPFKLPEMPDLPIERVMQARPFQFSAVDYAGPIQVKSPQGKVEKRWISLFTCLVTRAIHLESVPSQSTAEFLNAFWRFVARRGNPETMISDNASQFVMAAEVLKLKWNFITSHAPWMGGVYERLVGVMKQALRKAFGKSLLTSSEFENVLVKVEGILNTRPITPVTDDSMEVLRPVDFLQPNIEITESEYEVPKGFKKSKNLAKELREKFKNTKKCLENFWSIWKRQYLDYLLEQSQTEHKQGHLLVKRAPRLGEMVLIFDEDTHCGSWKLARILELIEGRNGRVRAARLKAASGAIVERPISHLYSLEIFDEEIDVQTDEDQARDDSVNDSVTHVDSNVYVATFCEEWSYADSCKDDLLCCRSVDMPSVDANRRSSGERERNAFSRMRITTRREEYDRRQMELANRGNRGSYRDRRNRDVYIQYPDRQREAQQPFYQQRAENWRAQWNSDERQNLASRQNDGEERNDWQVARNQPEHDRSQQNGHRPTHRGVRGGRRQNRLVGNDPSFRTEAIRTVVESAVHAVIDSF